MDMSFKMKSSKPFDTVVEELEKNTAANMFRVLHIHDVQATLAEKEFVRSPLKIIEVCNAGFAFEALNKSSDVAMFMPCKFVVEEIDGEVNVTLARPMMISEMMPEAGLDELAASVESTLKTVMEQAL